MRRRVSRGQSEVLGYVLIFSIVLLSIGSLYVSGVASLNTYQETSELNNAEEAMLVFSHNVDDIIKQESPRRSVEIKSSERGIIGTTERQKVTISVNDSIVTNTSIRGFAYRGEAGSLVYTSGALFRIQDRGVVMQEEPAFEFNDDRIILNIVHLAGRNEYRGSGTSLTVLEHNEGRSTINYSSEVDQNVTIEMNTSTAQTSAWTDYFEEQGLSQESYNEDTGEIKYKYTGADDVLVRESYIWVDIEE